MTTNAKPDDDYRPELLRLFRQLGPAALDRLRGLLEHRCYPAEAVVFHQGESPRGIYLVRSGLLSLEHLTPGGRTVAMRLAAGTEVVALAECLTGNTHQLLARTLAPSVLDFAPRDLFLEFLEREPELTLDLLRRISRRVERLQQGCYEVTGRYPLADRLLGKLHDLAETCGVPTPDGVLLDLPLTVQNLADLLGCSRQWASKLLGEMEAEGLVRRSRRQIVLCDRKLALSPG